MKPADLAGLWTRSLITWPDGRSDTSTRVRWLQSLHLYVDLRQPMPAPNLSHVRCLDDLTLADCELLAMQEGFAGHLRFDGSHYDWERRIDFQPRSAHRDIGSLNWQGDVLIELGRDVDYREHWHRNNRIPAAPAAALALLERGGGHGILVRKGDCFMFARERRATLTTNGALRDCVAAAATLADAQALLDCEISFGTATGNLFAIGTSTLPFRVGGALSPRLQDGRLVTAECTRDGSPATRYWDIMEAEGAVDSILLIAD